jgi:type IV secretory pathway VirB10-like protein
MAEDTPNIREKEPVYRKKAQWFGLAAVILLCLTLILSVFTTGKKSTPQVQPLPIDRAEREEPDGSQHDLQERIRQERIRRQREIEAGRVPSVDNSQQRMQALVQRREDERQQQQPAFDRMSVEDEFKTQEKRRALMARRSKFGLRAMTATPVNQTTQTDPASKTAQPIEGLNIAHAQQFAEQEFQRLEHEYNQRSQPQAAFGLEQPIGQGAQPDPREEITVGKPASEAEPKPGQKLIPTGTVISGVLDQQLISDYAGPFRGLITHDVYDVTSNYILIPKGSRITGRCLRISNVNEPIQARMGLTVTWLVLPDGKRISFERRVAALDQAGVPALKDQVNYHFLAQFLGVMAYAILSSETSREGSGWANDDTFEGDLGNSMREQFAPLAAKYLNLVPTITLRTGTPLKIFLEDDVYAYPWDSLGKRLYQAHRASN